MQILLLGALLFTAAPTANDGVLRQIDVYSTEPQANPFTPEVVYETSAPISAHTRRAAVRASSRAGVVSAPVCARHNYTAVRAQYFTGPYDYKKQFDYPWHTTPSPSLPASIQHELGGIEPIPAPPGN